MKRSVVGIAVAAGVAFLGVQVLGTMPALPTIGTEVVAHASDATTVVDSQTAGDWSPVNKIDNLNRDFFVLCHD